MTPKEEKALLEYIKSMESYGNPYGAILPDTNANRDNDNIRPTSPSLPLMSSPGATVNGPVTDGSNWQQRFNDTPGAPQFAPKPFTLPLGQGGPSPSPPAPPQPPRQVMPQPAPPMPAPPTMPPGPAGPPPGPLQGPPQLGMPQTNPRPPTELTNRLPPRDLSSEIPPGQNPNIIQQLIDERQKQQQRAMIDQLFKQAVAINKAKDKQQLHDPRRPMNITPPAQQQQGQRPIPPQTLAELLKIGPAYKPRDWLAVHPEMEG